MKKLLLITCGLAIAAAVEAQVIHVPADYSTIQQGIDAANNGDTVLVSDGTYYEQINFKGKKPLMVASQFLFDNDTNHIYNTILDGQQLTNLDSASVVYFVSGEDTTSILCGFTVRNGKGTYTTDNYNDRQGGGIWISNAGAKIIHNRITHNTVDDTQPGNGESASGGGIGAKFGIGNYWIVIADNTIDSNSCISTNEYATGGGISLSYNARIINNIISHNTTRGYQSAQVWGGGMYLAQSTGWPSGMAIIESNTIISNNTEGLVNTCAAGLECDNMKIIFSDNLVAENIINPGGSGGGAGFLLYQPEEGSIISNNIFKKNKSNLWIGGGVLVQTNSVAAKIVLVENNYFIDNRAPVGGAFGILNNPVLFQNNVFSGNQAGNSGGALHLSNSLNLPYDHIATIINCAFFDNGATINGGAMYSYNTKPLIFNSIFWCDSANNGQEIFTSINDTVEIAYSNINPGFIYGNFYDGSGNINENPLFEDLELLTISENSPCINTGTAEYICHCNHLHTAPAYDILGTLRPLNDNFEMGAYEKLTTQGQIIHVPADYPTIQQGIDAANNGDTVLVADGIYYEQINFLGKKPLVVASEFITDGDTNHIANTIIDGSQINNLDSASVVYLTSGEDTTSVLAGFTIQNGKGTISGTNSAFRGGGGVFIHQSGAKIIYNHITQNHLSDTISGNAQIVTGAGIHYRWEESDEWIVIDHNVIDYNSCFSTGSEAGSVGIDINCNTRISYNTIAHNEAIANETCHSLGAGFTCWTDPSWNDTVTAYIHHNVIKNNLSFATNSFAEGAGGMIWRIIGIFTDNVVEDNEVVVSNFTIGGGAGIYVWRSLEGSVIRDNIFKENNCNKNGGAMCVESYANDPNVGMVLIENNYFLDNHASKGGAFVTLHNPVTLNNNVFSSNNSDDVGGAVYLNLNATSDIPHLASFINNSFYNNKTIHNGGAIYSNNARPLIFNSIFRADSAALANEIFEQSSDTIEVGFCNVDPALIQGGYFMDGGGNINEDPSFDDPELLTLSENSPCINTGTSEYTCHCNNLHFPPNYDIVGNPRPLNGFFEMGAYEKLITGIENHPSSKTKNWYSVYPNPFADNTKIIYEIESKTQVDIMLYNSNGELIKTLLSEPQEAGNHELQFNSGNLPAGIYFYRITTDSKQATGRMILMK